MLKVVNLSKPFDNWANKENEKLFAWAEAAWVEFFKEIQDLLEDNAISDDDFMNAVNLLAQVDSDEGVRYIAYGASLEARDVADWTKQRNLPSVDKREELLRSLLLAAIKCVREKKYENYFSSIVRLVGLKDYRKSGSCRVITPSSIGRGIHRLGLPRRLSNLLAKNGITDLGDLKNITHPRRSHTFSDTGLLKIKGIGPGQVVTIKLALAKWDDRMMTPSTIKI